MARVFLVEDNKLIRDAIKDVLVSHQVVLVASSLPEALASVAEAIELQCTVAIVDGSLGTGSRGDGAKVAAAIRAKAPDMKILAHSSEIQSWGDTSLQKPAFGELDHTVSSLAGE